MWIWICRGGRKEAGDARGRAAALVPPAPARWGTKSCSRGFYSRPYRSPRRLPSQSGGAGQSQRQTGLIQASRKKTLQLHRKNIFQPIKSTCQTTISKKKKREEVNLRRGGGKGRGGNDFPWIIELEEMTAQPSIFPHPPKKITCPLRKQMTFLTRPAVIPGLHQIRGVFVQHVEGGWHRAPPPQPPETIKRRYLRADGGIASSVPKHVCRHRTRRQTPRTSRRHMQIP